MKMLNIDIKQIIAVILIAGAINATAIAASLAPTEKQSTPSSQQVSADIHIGKLPTMDSTSVSNDEDYNEDDMEDTETDISLDDYPNINNQPTTNNLFSNEIHISHAAYYQDNPQDNKKSSTQKQSENTNGLYKPFTCPVTQCTMRCFSVNGLLYHILSIHCTKTADTKPSANAKKDIKSGELVCTCGVCKDVWTTYAAAGIQPPQQSEEKGSVLDGSFTCKNCNGNVNRYTCVFHMLNDCPQKPMES